MGIQEFANLYKSLHFFLIFTHQQATLAFVTSTFGARRLQILHVLEPALQLPQLS